MVLARLGAFWATLRRWRWRRRPRSPDKPKEWEWGFQEPATR